MIRDLTATPIRDAGVRADASGSLVIVRLPCGTTAALTHEQALALAAELMSATNRVIKRKPGGAS